MSRGLTKKAEPPPTRGVNRDSGTASANGGWLRRLVRPRRNHNSKTLTKITPAKTTNQYLTRQKKIYQIKMPISKISVEYSIIELISL
jgi:hypothetical protein